MESIMKFGLTLLLLTLQLSACGGGSSGGSPQMPSPSGLVYPSPPLLIIGTAITPLTPTVSGTVTQYAISPALPAGLSLSTITGEISGTPAAPAGKTSYTVTASNGTGSTSAAVSIQLDRYSGARAASAIAGGNRVAGLARGSGGCARDFSRDCTQRQARR